MPTPIESRHDESKAVAFNAILTAPDSNSSQISEFLTFLEKNQFTPIASMSGFPVYRLDDIRTNTKCYMSNERTPDTFERFSTVAFSVYGSYLVFSDSVQHSDGNCKRYIVSQKIINIAAARLGKAVLTPAELRLVAQVLSGLQLKTAANEDDVSLETKRSQMKSVLGKIGVGRQQELMRILLPELVHLTNPQSWSMEGQQLFNRYTNDFVPEDVRCTSIVDRQGRLVRIIDYGPLRGKPVLILHSMIFPDITGEDVKFAHKHGLRLIWPVRPGVLQSSPKPKATSRYGAETLQGIELAWEHMCGEPVSIIAMVSSAWHATEFAQANPEKVSNITFAATCFSAGKYENNLVYFGSSIAELCSRNIWLMTRTVDFIRKNAHDTERFKSTFTRIFKNSESDMAVLDREFGEPHRGARLMMAMLESTESVKHDYFNQVNFHWSSISQLKVPVRFAHGALDTVHKLRDVKKLINGIGDIPLDVFDSTGHIMQYHHFHQLLCTSLALDNC